MGSAIWEQGQLVAKNINPLLSCIQLLVFAAAAATAAAVAAAAAAAAVGATINALIIHFIFEIVIDIIAIVHIQAAIMDFDNSFVGIAAPACVGIVGIVGIVRVVRAAFEFACL